MRQLELGGFIDACLCTATGHVEAALRLWRFENYTLVGATSMELDAVLSRVGRFVVMEDVEAERLDLRLLRLQGPDSPGVSASISVEYRLPSFHSAPGGMDLWIDPSNYASALAELGDVPLLADSLVTAAEIEAGIPRAGIDWNARTLAAELGPNFNSRTVSLEKGCYVGQEVIMRIASRGHTNREWVPLVLSRRASPNDAVIGPAGSEVGAITRAAESPRFGPIAAAMLRNEAAIAGTGVSVGGAAATVAAFPLLSI